MSVWATAITLPMTIESAASPTRIADMTRASDSKATRQTRPSAARPAALEAAARKAATGALRLVSVRRPGVKRKRRNLESQPRAQQADGRQEDLVILQAALGQARGEWRQNPSCPSRRRSGRCRRGVWPRRRNPAGNT